MTEDTGLEMDHAPSDNPAVRLATATLGAGIAIAGLAWGADLYRIVGWNFLAEQFLAAVLGMALALVYLTRPFRRHWPVNNPAWYDWVFAAICLANGIYVAFAYPRILSDFFTLPIDGLIASWIFFVFVIEALRRTSGWSLVVVVLVFTVYALVGHLVGGDLQTRKVELNNMVFYLGIDTSGLFGLVLLIGVTVVIPFIFFGQLLSSSGGAVFFNDVSLALMGRFRGGSAKIAVLASSLFGSINGIVVSNILATGVITIPMMKKSGFKPEKAAAIEATASNGGQLMPPVMGAVAFLMADFLQISYADVAIAALVPSLLYYFALFIQVDLEAAKDGIVRVPRSEIPRLLKVLALGSAFILPFAVLIYALFWRNLEAENAAIIACLVVMVVGFVVSGATDRLDLKSVRRGVLVRTVAAVAVTLFIAWLYGQGEIGAVGSIVGVIMFGTVMTFLGSRLTMREVWACVVRTGMSSADIIMIAAAAGFIMGILQLTGLGFALTLLLVKLGAGNVFILLLIAAVMCIVLGMGMPTLGVYVLLAVLIAPALVEVGISQLAAHMFILYLGMMSFVTPPVCIAAFFAANLAKSDPMRTGWVAMRFSWTAYIVPFLFVFSPTLLLQSNSPVDIAVSIATALAGVWLVSAGMIGYGLRAMTWPLRMLAIVAGGLLLLPPELAAWSPEANIAGALVAAGYLAFELVRRRRGTVSQGAPAE